MYNKIRVAIIDDGLNKELYNKLTGKNIDVHKIQDSVCINDGEDTTRYGINHGTICASILTEFTHDAEVISISLREQRKLPVQNLEAALYWCINNHIEMICMSIGVPSLLEMKRLLPLFDILANQGIIIVAAGSNIGKITYPASLPSVIGVRYVNTASKGMSIIDDPLDGIDIEADLPESNVLKKLAENFKYFIPISNSLVTPYVAAKIIAYMQKEESVLIDDFRRHFGIFMNVDFRKHENSRTIISRKDIPKLLENINVPIISLIYDDRQFKSSVQLSVFLKRILHRNGYNCILFSTSINKNIKENVFRLNEDNMTSDIIHLSQITLSDIILLHMSGQAFQHYHGEDFIDFIVNCGFADYDDLKKRDTSYIFVDSGNEEAQAELIFDKILEIFIKSV